MGIQAGGLSSNATSALLLLKMDGYPSTVGTATLCWHSDDPTTLWSPRHTCTFLSMIKARTSYSFARLSSWEKWIPTRTHTLFTCSSRFFQILWRCALLACMRDIARQRRAFAREGSQAPSPFVASQQKDKNDALKGYADDSRAAVHVRDFEQLLNCALTSGWESIRFMMYGTPFLKCTNHMPLRWRLSSVTTASITNVTSSLTTLYSLL